MKKNKSLLNKIILVVLIVTIATTFINISLLLIIRQNIFNLKVREQERYIDLYSAGVNDSLQNFINTANYAENFLYDKLADGKNVYPDIAAQKDIFSLLSSFAITQNQIQEAFIYSENSEFLYTSSGLTAPSVFYYNRFSGSFDKWDSLISARYTSPTLVAITPSMHDPIIKDNRQMYPRAQYYIIKTISSKKGVNTNIILTTTDTFSSTANPNESDNDDSTHLFILDNENNIIAGDKNYMSGINMQGKIKDENSDEYYPAKGMISSRSSTMNGIYYVMISPSKVLLNGINTIFLISIIASFVAMIIMAVFAIRSSSRLYRPYTSIIDAINDTNSNKAVDKNDLEYVKNRVIEAVSINMSIRENSNNPAPLLLEVILFKLIMGTTNSNKMFAEAIALNISLDYDLYNVVLIRMDLRIDSDELFFTEYSEVFNNIIISHDNASILKVIEIRQNEYAVVNYFKNESDYALLNGRYNTALAELVAAIPNSSFLISCSTPVKAIEQINDAYKECVDLIKFRTVNENETVIFKKDKLVQTESYFPTDFDSEIANMIAETQKEMAVKYIDYILDRNYKSNISMQTYVRLCSKINSLLLSCHKGKNETDLITIKHDDYMYSVKMLNEIIFTNLEITLSFSKEKGDDSTSPHVLERVINYVDKHFTEDINLAIVAQNLGYTPNYLSKFFKQEKGINFTDYINRKRIDYAKKLLLQSKLSVKQVAVNSGFNSATLFIRTFEKYVAVTPGEYRKLSLS